MTNVEKLVDFIDERDPSGKVFNQFAAILQMGLTAMENKAEATVDVVKEAEAGKSVTEYGEEIADIMKSTPKSLQDLQDIIEWCSDFLDDLTPPNTILPVADQRRTASVLVGCMRDKAEQIQADLERLEMVCDKMREAGA